MNNRLDAQKKPSSNSAPVQNQLQSRPFAVQAKTEAVSPQPQEKLAGFGHNLANISIFAPHTPIQTKLAIGKPGDKYEQEADRVAAQVVNKINSPQHKDVQRKALNTSIVQQPNAPTTAQTTPKLSLKHQPLNTIQRELVGHDPLVNYTQEPQDKKDLLYGIGDFRNKTVARLRQGPDQELHRQGRAPLRTIDQYNAAVGINGAMANSEGAIGIFKIRAALKDPDNWTNYLVAPHLATDPNLKLWVQKLVANRQKIGLEDIGEQTKQGIFFKRKKGLNKLNSKSRFTKNLDGAEPTDARANINNITQKQINSWLDPNRTLPQAEEEYNRKGQDAMTNRQKVALSTWITTAFFRRTSKLGIDFATAGDGLDAKIHFNLAAALKHNSNDPKLSTVRQDGIKDSERKFRYKAGKPITISEYKHVKKQIRAGKIDKEKFNFYSEY